MKAEAHADGRNMGYEESYADGFAAAEVDAYNEGYDEALCVMGINKFGLNQEMNFEN